MASLVLAMGCLLVGTGVVQAQQLLDDFNRPAGTTVGGSWIETETVASGAQINALGQLELGSTTAGREYVAQDMSGFYNTTFGSNSCLLTWAFCIRQSRADPSGFAASNYGNAFVLGASSGNLNTVSTGYAVVLGQALTTDNLRLVRFTGGLAGTQTNLITGAADLGAQYMAIRVTFNPTTGQWQLFATTTLTAGNFSTTNPTSAVTLIGSAINTTYTATNLPFGGYYWNHATGAGEAALLDNVYIPQLCIPTVTFATASALTAEPAGTVTVNLNIFPATVTGGNIVITAVNGAGVTYGIPPADYNTTPAVVTSDITIPVAAGATTASFTIALNNDILDEGNEVITFTITSTTGDLVLGTAVVYTQTIVDDDGAAAVNFTTLSLTVLETAAGVYQFNLLISPAATANGNVTISIANGIGATCGFGLDYQMTGFGCPPTRVLPVVIGQTALSFQVTVYDDVLTIEPTEQVTFTITGVPAGMAIGSNNTGVLYIGDNDTPPSVLSPGDLVIVGVNANNAGCPGGSSGEDYISFFCFKEIVPGTSIILTDNGWERCVANRWGNTEGTVQMTRTGVAIPAGQVITFRVSNSSGVSNIIGAAPDGAWTCASLNGGTTFNMNVGGDQVFFMQGGTWTTNTVGGHDAQYSGNILYGFSTNAAVPWTATCASPAGNQRSNLPLGMNCFSMAPTLATDYNKYVGPLTIATQRDWIIRVDNTANWNSSGSCGAYNAALPNWLLAPTLPITVGGFTPGLWRGTTSTDWFDCKNWDDATVPVTTTNVRVDETAGFHCVVGVTPGGNAVCASVVQTNSGSPKNITVQSSSSLAVGGPITMQRTSNGGAIFLTVLTGSTLSASNLTVQGTLPNEAWFRNEDPLNTVTLSGDLFIGTGGVVDLQAAAVGGRVFIGGNYTDLGPNELNLAETNGTIIFNGTGAQSISTAGFQEVFYNLTVAKATGSLTLNDPLAVRNVLDLTSGLINTSSPAGLLTMRAGSSWINATDASFVNGPIEKIGLTDFTFPVGKGADMRPCGITGITGVPADAFEAEYFPISAYTWGVAMEPTIDHLSQCEYWMIGRSAGSADATVELTWEAPASCGVTDLPDLIVARWDGSIWRDRGNGGAVGSPLAGIIPTAIQQTLFSPWTLASISSENPLPITLVDFTARPEHGMVRLDWVTASEHENAFFSVERSTDGIIFEHLFDVPGAINSNVTLTYTDLDRTPYTGLSYYRLRQTDTDGNSTVSRVVAVMFGALEERPLLVFGTDDDLTALHGFPAGSRYTLLDMAGRIIQEGATTMDGRTDIRGLDLANGAYVFRLVSGERAESARFVR